MQFGKRNPALERLKQLADSKGYWVTTATMSGHYRLIDLATDERATAPDGSAAFTIPQAMRFLKGLDVRHRKSGKT